ncbi:MAG: GNAT family N-acetyltransferase [Clostridia bacterium]|nr:GNAT family N-acetyltransferase [Clostridia bacterium]
MYTLTQAKPEELTACIEIISEGRAFQQEQGFIQWTESYPSPALLEEDIRSGGGYLFKIDGEPAAYMFLAFDGDPAYSEETCCWRKDVPYVVVHRLALARRFAGRGLSAAVFESIRALCLEKGVRCIRIDTDSRNMRMQHVLEKCGFVRCGTVFFQGGAKLTYDNFF